MKKVILALGLKEGASEAQAVKAINNLKAENKKNLDDLVKSTSERAALLKQMEELGASIKVKDATLEGIKKVADEAEAEIKKLETDKELTAKVAEELELQLQAEKDKNEELTLQVEEQTNKISQLSANKEIEEKDLKLIADEYMKANNLKEVYLTNDKQIFLKHSFAAIAAKKLDNKVYHFQTQIEDENQED